MAMEWDGSSLWTAWVWECAKSRTSWQVEGLSLKQASLAPRLVTTCTIAQELPFSSKKCSEWLWQSGYLIDSS